MCGLQFVGLPVLRGKRDSPESRRWLQNFNSDFRFRRVTTGNPGHPAIQFFFRFVMRTVSTWPTVTGDSGGKCAACVYDQGVGHFVDGLALGAFPVNRDSYTEKDSLNELVYQLD